MKFNINTISLILDNLDYTRIKSNWEIIETKTSFRASNHFISLADTTSRYDSLIPFTIIFSKVKTYPNFKILITEKSLQEHKNKRMIMYLSYIIKNSITKTCGTFLINQPT